MQVEATKSHSPLLAVVCPHTGLDKDGCQLAGTLRSLKLLPMLS